MHKRLIVDFFILDRERKKFERFFACLCFVSDRGGNKILSRVSCPQVFASSDSCPIAIDGFFRSRIWQGKL